MLEETGLVVEVGAVLEVFERIARDEDGRVRHHYVLIDYLCRPVGGRLGAASDVSEVRVVAPADLAGYGVTPLVEAVVAKALRLVAGDGVGPRAWRRRSSCSRRSPPAVRR